MKDLPSFPRRWSKLKIILKPSLFVISLILLLVPAYVNQISITRVYQGLEVPSGPVEINLNFTNPIDVHINFPFRIENSGFHKLRDINLKITLRLNYSDINSGEGILRIILSEKVRLQDVGVGKIKTGILYNDYSKFNWGYIGDFVTNVDETKDVGVLMDIDLSFYMSWVEKDRISISDIELVSEIKTSTEVQSKESINYTFYMDRFYFMLVLLLTMTSIFIFFFNARRIRQDREKDVFSREKGSIEKTRWIFTLSKVLVYSVFVITFEILLLFRLKKSSLITSDYALGYEISILLSIFILILIDILILLPLFQPVRYHKYSIKESIRSLVTSGFGVFYILSLMIAAVETYKIGNSMILIRDTSPSFIPFIILDGSYIILKFIDTLNFSKFRIHYRKLKIYEEKRLKYDFHTVKNVNELNYLIFNAIRDINSEATRASLSKIRAFVKRERKLIILRSGIRLNHNYLKSLVDKDYLKEVESLPNKENKKNFITYALTLKANSYLTKIG